MKKLLLILFLPLFLFYYIDFQSTASFFSSPVFISYYENLEQITPLDFKPGTASQNKVFFQERLKHLREQLSDNNEQALSVAHWIYTENLIWDKLPGISEDHSLIDLENALLFFNKSLKASLENPKNKGWYKPGDRSRDLHYFGNIPFPLFHLKSGPLVIRTPVPLIDDHTVSPEFYGFLKTVNKHLYINLMKMKKEEKPQTETVHLLENDPSIDVTVMTLDASSSFFWQEEDYENLNDASQFKGAFLQKLLSENEGYRWSSKMNLKDSFQPILEEIHQKYFQLKPTLSVNERIDFIQIATLAIIELAANSDRFNTMNVSCQHTLDRGGAMLALLYIKERADNTGTLPMKDLQKAVSLITEVPPLFHNRSTHARRASQIPSTLRTIYLRIQ